MYEDHRTLPTPPTVGSTVGTHCGTNELETSPPKLPHAAKKIRKGCCEMDVRIGEERHLLGEFKRLWGGGLYE
jgi:hypothetical protein